MGKNTDAHHHLVQQLVDEGEVHLHRLLTQAAAVIFHQSGESETQSRRLRLLLNSEVPAICMGAKSRRRNAWEGGGLEVMFGGRWDSEVTGGGGQGCRS